MYLFTTLGASAIAAVLLYVPGIYDLGHNTIGYYPVGMIGLWGIPAALAVSIGTLTSFREKERRSLKLFAYPVMYLLIFSLILVVVELLVHSPFNMTTVPSGNQYSDFSLNAVFTFLGLPFCIAVGLIFGTIFSVASLFGKKENKPADSSMK